MPKPMTESGEVQSYCSLATMPILDFAWSSPLLGSVLNPSLLQFHCKDEPAIRDFHVARDNDVARYTPSAMSEYSDLACLGSKMNRVSDPTFMPRQILVNGVFQ